ncbi:uncharacterized protein LOC135686636 [Rhopilema esculentum]|uniref:uncharacterized protein LOC135686636 n=1 Tax=Rhopilema esculentum TaxID=499914 RepID=UPI0031D5EECA|eukprot:gene141-9758_t
MAMISLSLITFLLISVCAGDSDLKVDEGQVTFDAEGNDNPRSRYFSRKLHVPSAWSGITVGRGYDIKYKRKKVVLRDLRAIGLGDLYAKKIAGGVGKFGGKAKKYIKAQKLQSFTITRRQQKNLFKITFAREKRETKRLVTKYYKRNLDRLNGKIQEILIDLKFRGDFRPTSRSNTMVQLKKAVQRNSLADFTKVMSNRRMWRNVPFNRFISRKNFLLH